MTHTTPSRAQVKPTVGEMIDFLDWYISNIIKPSSDNYNLQCIRDHLVEEFND